MEDEKIIVNAVPGMTELIIKKGVAENPDKPLKISISGILNAPSTFIKAKAVDFKPLECHCIVDMDSASIKFVGNERSVYQTVIVGSLKPTKILSTFKINADGKFKEKDLAKLLRRHPFLFDSEVKADYEKLIVALLNFSATITTTIESNTDHRGNLKNLLEKVVDQKIPGSIKFTAPIFEGEDNLTFEVFICCEATSNSVEFYLDSPELVLLEESEKKRLLNTQAQAFEEFGCAVINI